MVQKYKLNIFNVLSNIDQKHRRYYDNLSEEEQKAFQPYVIARWLSGCNDPRQVFLLNEVVNPLVWEFSNHKALLYKLMTLCTTGSKKRYEYIKPSTQSSKYTYSVSAICAFLNCSKREALGYIDIYSKDDIVEMAQRLAMDKTIIKKLKQELKNRK